MRGRSKVSPASEEEEPEAEMCALARACSSSLLLNAQLQLPLDVVVVVVDSALGLVDVVLVVVVGVVQGADCSGPLCTTGTSARLPCSNAWVVVARGRNCPPIHLQPFANNHNPSLLSYNC